MRTQKLFAALVVAGALAPATAKGQGGEADKTGKDINRYLQERERRSDAASLKREIEVSVEDADLRDVMDEIGRKVGRNIIVEPDVNEHVTISLRKIPWEDAVQVIAKMTKCEVERRGAILVLTQPPKVTIQFTDANVRTVLQLLAAYSGKNIIISPEVRGDVTLDLKDVHWLKALYAIVRTIPGNFEVVEDTPDLLRVVPASSIAQQLKVVDIPLHYLRPPSKYLATPPRTAIGNAGVQGGANLFIGNPTAPTGVAQTEFTLFRALQGIVNSSRSQVPGTAIEYDQQKNAFLVRGTAPLIEELRQIVARLDQEPAQVFVEVRFISTTDSNFFEFGLKPSDAIQGFNVAGPFPSGQTVPGNNYLRNAQTVTPPPTTLGSNTGFDPQNVFVADTQPRAVGTFPFDIGKNFGDIFRIPAFLDFRGLNATLNAIDRDTRTRLLQTPSLFVRDNEDAVIFVGEQVPFAQVNSTPDINGNVVQTIGPGNGSPIALGFSLFISAHVVPETDRIMLTLIPRVSTPGGSSGNQNIFDTFTIGQVSIQLPHTKEQALVTHVMVDDNQTAVIGGLLTEQDQETITRIPIISRIPLLGNLFTHTSRTKAINNLLVLVTTTIVRTKAQSVALWKTKDAQWKARDYFYKKFERMRSDEDKGKYEAGSGQNILPSPPATEAPAAAPAGTAEGSGTEAPK